MAEAAKRAATGGLRHEDTSAPADAAPASAPPATTAPAATAPAAPGVRPYVRASYVVLAIALPVAAIVALGIGPVAIPAAEVVDVVLAWVGLGGAEVSRASQVLVLDVRMPRVLLALVVGSALAVSGATMQGIFRNPLADPGLIGVSAGAACAAACYIVLAKYFTDSVSEWGLPFAAFVGALLVTTIVWRVGKQGGQVSIATVLLAGIAINALTMAGVGVLMLIATDAELRDLTFWNLGSLGGANWTVLGVAAVVVIPPTLLLPRLAPALNTWLLGDAEVRHLGIDPQRLKRIAFALTALAVGGAVSMTGVIGFLGLVIPHLVRLLVGPDHRTLMPLSALLGAVLMLVADTAARTVAAPIEVPIGIMTAFAGAPFFLWLMRRRLHLDGMS
ncbi:MAG: iron ABC transporter permease [Myxococcota bacterium]